MIATGGFAYEKGMYLKPPKDIKGKLRENIINGKVKYAGIYFKGENFNVVEGDSIAGGRVKNIGKFGITVEKQGQDVFYDVETTSLNNQQTKLGDK